MKLLDIHAHLNFPQYDADRQAVIKRTVEAGCGVINVGTDLKTSREVIKLAEQYPDFYATVGFHPDECQGLTLTEEAWRELAELAKHEKVVAIGECGLDYFRLEGEIEKIKLYQRQGFEKQIELAVKINKPLMLHIRDSYDDVLAILKNFPRARGNAHFFAGSLPQAKRFLDLGFTLSFTGVITFTHDYDKLIKFIPLDRLMAETDAPYVAPAPYRGQRNEPLYVAEVIKRLAEIKGVSQEAMMARTLATARAFCYATSHV